MQRKKQQNRHNPHAHLHYAVIFSLPTEMKMGSG